MSESIQKEGELWYPEDIKLGSTYFGSPVVYVENYNPINTYLCVYKFTLKDGSTRKLFNDQELDEEK